MKLITNPINTLLLLSLLTICVSCNGQQNMENKTPIQNPPIKAISIGKIVAKMESNPTVIFQDSQYNYWFGGGDQGVYKYDGKTFLLYTIKDGLISPSILTIQEDKDGNIYFETPIGVSKYDGKRFSTLTIIDHKTSHNEWKLTPDDLWFSLGWYKKGPYRYDGEFLYELTFPEPHHAAAFYSKNPNASYNPYGIYTIYKDRKGNIWFGTASLGVCRYDGQSISWLYENQLTTTPSGGDFGIRSIIEDKEVFFLFCNTRYRFDISPNNLEKNGTNYINYNRAQGIGTTNDNNEMDYPYFMSIAMDNKGDLWMLSYDDGVRRNNGKELIHYPIKDGDQNVLLRSIYKDNKGFLWLISHHAGVYKYNGNKFVKFQP